MDKLQLNSGPGIHPKSIKAIQNSINPQKPDLTQKRLPNFIRKGAVYTLNSLKVTFN